MANDNSVTIIGNATREPEVRYTNGALRIRGWMAFWAKRRLPS